jgi:hypothetical protein
MDTDGSGTLDKEEFEAVMMVLFGNVMMRVLIQYACTLLVVPMIAQLVLNGIAWCIHYAYQTIATLDEHYQFADVVEVNMERIWVQAITFWSDKVPAVAHTVGAYISGCLDAIPDSVWNSIPLTLLSSILSLILIPWSLMKIDDLFQILASTKSNK